MTRNTGKKTIINSNVEKDINIAPIPRQNLYPI